MISIDKTEHFGGGAFYIFSTNDITLSKSLCSLFHSQYCLGALPLMIHSVLVHSGFIFFIALIPLKFSCLLIYCLSPAPPHPQPKCQLFEGWDLCVSIPAVTPMSEQCLAHDTCRVSGSREVRA